MDIEDPSTRETAPDGMPRVLGPCRLLRPLGAGGMGTVFLAEMIEDRPYARRGSRVAIKVLHKELLQATNAFRRFLREAQLGQSIRHPAVVRTFEVDAVAIGRDTYHFLVLEYVEGQTLGDLLRELGVLPEALLRALAAQVARGLAAVHAAHAVHRDVKPANVLVTADHQVKLMDMGVARLCDEGASLTRPDSFVGTLLYAAPEQLDGGDVGPEADLYALGVVLYEAATGTMPFTAPTAQGIIARHLEHTPARASTLCPELTPFLDEAIACLIDKDRGRRFGPAALVAEVLEAGESSPWWQEREAAARATRPPRLPNIPVARDVSLAGREAPLAELKGLLDQARQGHGRLVLIEGEAGVGKTRLASDLVQGLDPEQWHVLYGAEAPGTAGRRGALEEAVLGLLGEAALEASLARYLKATPALVPAFAARLLGNVPPAGAEPISAEALPALFCHLARALATERPVVWIVDDLHSGSADARSILLVLARIAHDRRLLFLGLTRPEATVEDIAAVPRIPLARLADAEVGGMVREALGAGSLADRLSPTIARRSDGNPFFVLELVHEARRLDPGAGTAALEVPSSVRGLVAARLRDLVEEERTVLDVAAVLGFRFDPDLIARVLERRRLAVLQDLARLERRARLVHAAGTQFTFDQHQLQEVLYAALPEALRAEYHGLLAAAYGEREGVAGKSPEAVEGEAALFVVEHGLKSGRVGEDLGPLVRRALAHLAGEHRSEAVVALAALALAAPGRWDPALRCDLRLGQADALHLLGRFQEAGQAAEGAIADAADDVRRRARARGALGRARTWLADLSGALVVFEQALDDARTAGDGAGEAGLLTDAGDALLALGRYAESQAFLERAVARALALGERATEARAAASLGFLLLDLERRDEAERLIHRAAELFRQTGDRLGELRARFHLGLLESRRDRRAAQEHYRHTLTAYRALGHRSREAAALGCLGLTYIQEGDLARARAELDEAGSIHGEIGNRYNQAICRLSLGRIAILEGRLELAGAQLASARSVLEQLGTERGIVPVHIFLGELAEVRGDLAGARLHLEQALAAARRVGGWQGAGSLLSLGRLLLAQGDPDSARSHLEEAARTIAEVGDNDCRPAAYLALLGERDPATVTVADELGVAERAEAHLVLYRAGASGDHLGQARALLERLSSHLTGDDREAFWRNNLAARGVRAAESGSHDHRR